MSLLISVLFLSFFSIPAAAQTFDISTAMLCLGKSVGDQYAIFRTADGFKLYSAKGTAVITEASAKQQKCFVSKATPLAGGSGMKGGKGIRFKDPQSNRGGQDQVIFFAGSRDDGGISQKVSSWNDDGWNVDVATEACKWPPLEMPSHSDTAFLKAQVGQRVEYVKANYLDWKKNFKDTSAEGRDLIEKKLSNVNWTLDKCDNALSPRDPLAAEVKSKVAAAKAVIFASDVKTVSTMPPSPGQKAKPAQ